MATTNYTDQDSITIDDINSTPIATGYNYTFGSVFGAINKIIKAIVNKFKSVDTDIENTSKDIQGITGTTVSLPSSSITLSSKTNSSTYTLTINTKRKYTHGYFILYEGDEQITEIPYPWSQLTKNVYQTTHHGGSAYTETTSEHYLSSSKCYAYFSATSTDNQIQIKYKFYNGNSSSATIPANCICLKYELY